MSADEKTSIAIIGGGPGGLMAAYLLQKAGLDGSITLFERSNRLGGKVMTSRFPLQPDVTYEAGAAEFYDYSGLGPDPLRELIAELGLSVSRLTGGGAVFRDRIIHGPGDLLDAFGARTWDAVQAFSDDAKALISPSEYYDADARSDNDRETSKISFHELLQRVPDETARDYIGAMTHSDLACEPHQTNASYGLQNYLMDEPGYMELYSVDGGNERLIEALAGRLDIDIELGAQVTEVERADDGAYRVSYVAAGAAEAETFDYVVVALPNDTIPSVRWADERLATSMGDHHRYYDHPAHYLRVTMLFDEPFWRGRMSGAYFMIDAFGGCCLYDEGVRLEAGGKGVLGWLIAGEAALRLGNMDDAELVAHLITALPPILGGQDARLRDARVHRWAGAVNALPAGYPARDPDSRHQPDPAGHPGLFVMGDYLFDSTINGVLDSAVTVVDFILEGELAGVVAEDALEALA
jgi:protoporphyrinogen oxidase